MANHTVLSTDDRQGPAAHPILSIQGINEFVAAEIKDIEPQHNDTAPSNTSGRTEPYGMYWVNQNNHMTLRPHTWFIQQVSTYADGIFGQMYSTWGSNKDTRAHIKDIRSSLGLYLAARGALNDFAPARKLKQEADDACYQMCQAAKFFIDASEKAKWLLDHGRDLESNEQLQKLKSLAEKAGYEGYILMQAIREIDSGVKLDLEPSARRVVEWSCRKLSEWFGAREQNINNEQRLKNLAQAVELLNLFKPGNKPNER